VDDSDLKNLRESGLTDDTILANGLYTSHHRYWPGLVFPYLRVEGGLSGFDRRRLHEPQPDADGHMMRYKQAKGTQPHAYFPRGSITKLFDGQCESDTLGGPCPVFITEGEKKALALAQLGLAAIGLGGVWCGCTKQPYKLIADLRVVPWKDVIVYIIFDADPKLSTQRSVAAAAWRLARALKEAGAAEVYNVRLPLGEGGTKMGVDDFLVRHGAAAFHDLVEKAEPVRPVSEAGDVIKGVTLNESIPPVLGEAAKYGWIGDFLRAVAPYTEATDPAVLAHLLPTIGTLIGPHVYTWAGGKQYCRINTALVGPPCIGRKGTGVVAVDEVMGLAAAEFWKTQRLGSGLSSGEGLIKWVEDPKGKKKKADEEGEDEDGEDKVKDKRWYIVETEFPRVLACINRESNVLAQVICQAWDGCNLQTMTVDPRTATGVHISITFHTTPDDLRARLPILQMNDGLGSRIDWFASESDKELPEDEPIPREVLQPFVERLQALRNVHTELTKCGNLLVRRDAEAQALWKTVYGSRLRLDRPGLLGKMVARAAPTVLRIALIYAVADCPIKRTLEDSLPYLDTQDLKIRLPHLQAALAVWAYCEESARQLFRGVAATPPTKEKTLEDKVVELLASEAHTKTELNTHVTPDQRRHLGEALKNLVGEGRIKATRIANHLGRPGYRYSLVYNPPPNGKKH
jgi:hypothetical protein